MEPDAVDSIHVEQLEIFARVGVTDSERNSPQRITLSITVWPKAQFNELSDDISRTVNYSALCVAAREFLGNRSDKLIETMAEQLASHFLQNFPVQKVRIELRKFVLPDAQYASVVVERSLPV